MASRSSACESLVAYHSVTGNTGKMAHAASDGARRADASVELNGHVHAAGARREQIEGLRAEDEPKTRPSRSWKSGS